MSHDQRPGRVRVFSSGTMAETQRRRRTDTMPVSAPGASPRADETGAGAAAASLRTLVMRALLFLFGCAIGGVLVSLASLNGLFGR